VLRSHAPESASIDMKRSLPGVNRMRVTSG
jgi:hypothetical protein